MRRLVSIAGLVAVSLLFGCSSGLQTAQPEEESWGQEADTLVALLVDAYDVADPYQTARFFTAGGTLDLTIWGRGVATSPEEVVQSVRQLWFQRPDFATVEAEHLFVSLDGAVVWWWAYSNDGDGGQDWAQSYSFGAGGRAASRGFRGIETGFGDSSPVEQAVSDLADRYVEAWAAKDPGALGSLYASEVLVRDDIRGLEWRSVDELLADLSVAPGMEPGPWPRVFVYESGSHVEAIVLVQLNGDCPMLEARRWVLDGELIVKELRFTHVPSARRCLRNSPSGWWSTYELPPDLQDNVTEIVDAGGSLVELVNAEPVHEAHTRWLFSRFIESGIGVPEVSAVWFPPSAECAELSGLAIESDERYQGRHTVVVCFVADRLVSDVSESGWSPAAAAFGLHELAHIWMVDHLTDATRAEFNELAGLSEWRSAAVPWRERGVEHAAFTISWGLAGAADGRYPILPAPECEALSGRYQLLTGHLPITACGEGGWTP